MKRFIETAALLLILFCSAPRIHAEGESSDVDLWKKLVAEGEAALVDERTPIPQSVPMVDLIWDDGTAAHGFFVELPRTKALILALPNRHRIRSMKWQGRDFKPGALILRRVSGGDSLWVFQAPASLQLPPCPVKKSPSVPLIGETSELVVVTGAGPCDAAVQKNSIPGGILLPGQPDISTKRARISAQGFANVRPGDPLFLKQNGALIGAFTEVHAAILPGELPAGFPFLLNFPNAPKLPGASLTQVWGLPIAATSQEDDRFFKEVLPLQATQDKLGESMDAVLKRNPYLGRLSDRPFLDSAHREDLGMEWPFKYRVVVQEKGVVTRFEYESSPGGESSPGFIFQWLCSKFGVPAEFYGHSRDPVMGFLALWSVDQAKITFAAIGKGAGYPIQLRLLIYGASRVKQTYVNNMFFKPLPGNLPDMQKIVKEVEGGSGYKAPASPFMDDAQPKAGR